MDNQQVMDVMKKCQTFKEAVSNLDISDTPNKYCGLWKKLCTKKSIQEDDRRIEWAEDESIQLNSWQQAIYNDIIENINNKNDKIFFIINSTKTIRTTTIKRKYEDMALDEQQNKLNHLHFQKALVVQQNEELIEALIKESIRRRQLGQAACLMKNMYSRVQMRKPKNKYLSNTDRKIAVYDRIIFDLYNTGSSRKIWERFMPILNNLIQETTTPIILFYKKHFPYEDLPEYITPVVYEITNMYLDGVVNNITHEPAFKCLEPVEIKKKSKITRKAFIKRCLQQKVNETDLKASPDSSETPIQPPSDSSKKSIESIIPISPCEVPPMNIESPLDPLEITTQPSSYSESIESDISEVTSPVHLPYSRPPIRSRSKRRLIQ